MYRTLTAATALSSISHAHTIIWLPHARSIGVARDSRRDEETVGQDLEQGADGGLVQAALVRHGHDTADEAAEVHAADVLAQDVLGAQPLDDPVGGCGEDLALVLDRRGGVA